MLTAEAVLITAVAITIGGSSSSYTTNDNTGNGAFVAGGTVRGPANTAAQVLAQYYLRALE